MENILSMIINQNRRKGLLKMSKSLDEHGRVPATMVGNVGHDHACFHVPSLSDGRDTKLVMVSQACRPSTC